MKLTHQEEDAGPDADVFWGHKMHNVTVCETRRWFVRDLEESDDQNLHE